MATRRKADGGERLWRGLYDAVLEIHDHNIAALTSRGLTGGEIKAMLKMEPGKALPMRELADRWRSDASTATWMVDRLERKQLVERRAQPGDRRVRAVALTAKGEAELAAIRKQLYQPPRWWTQLRKADLEHVAEISERLQIAAADGSRGPSAA